MTSIQYSGIAGRWHDRIARISSGRCDLDVLLKDEWRHKVAVRDDHLAPPASQQHELVIADEDYAALKALLHNNKGVSVGGLALATLHTVLDAYGDGGTTVVAFMNAREKCVRGPAMLLPVMVNHEEQSALTCGATIQAFEAALQQEDAYVSQRELLGRGLFDAALMLTDRELSLADLPPFPLGAGVRDVEPDRRLVWTMWYAEELFDAKVIAGILDVVREVFGRLLSRPEQIVGDIELLSKEQRSQLSRWNATDGDFPETRRLNELFEDSARHSPERAAVVFRDTRLTYREVNERSNQLAYWLRGPAVGVKPQELIGLFLDKSDLGVIAALGIWKAGAAYVPIDPTYPASWIRFMIDDTGASGIIANRHHTARLRQLLGARHEAIRIVEVESVLADHAAALPRDNPQLGLASTDLAYVTYTSGTTGVPKGVAKDHHSVVNSVTDLSERYDMRQPGTERVALFSSYVFEPHLRQTLIALINSQTLVVVPEDVRLDPDRFPDYIARHGVTYLNATGSVLQHFDLRRCRTLKKILLVGEELTGPGLRRLRETFTGRIINEYAFTEAAFVTAVKEFAPGVVTRTDRSIGRPLRNVKWYVLSRRLKQLPIGAVGELYIGGCGVAWGYLNREDLTAERFYANPFQSEQEKLCGRNAKIYRTGDLARMLPNGEVEYLGRSDFQLKLNGVRVEPGEIEARTMEFPGVQKCVVVARDGAASGTADRHLIGYYTTEATTEVMEADLLAFLEERLIRVMVPARMVRVPHIPVNVNGKVDRRALPEVDIVGADMTRMPVDGDSVTGRLRDIWSSVLGIPATRIDCGDDFFRLGGQSISCILLIARVRQRLRLSVSVEDVFRLRTLGALAGHLQRQQLPAPEPTAEQAVADRSVAILANGLQQGLLYHALKSRTGDDAYVMQSVYRYRCGIRPELMKRAWQHARKKYPSLRLRFKLAEEPLQIIDTDDKPVDWRFVDLHGLAAADQETRIKDLQERDRAEPYRPTAGQSFRVYLIRQRADLSTLIFSCHHIIMDGWSMPVLHDEVHRIYLSLVQGLAIEPAEDRSYIAAQRYWERHRDDHVGYWMAQLDRVDERGDLDGLLNARSRYKVALSDYDHVLEHRTKQLRVGAERTAALTAACTANQVTLHSVLQFVWHKVLYAISGGNTTVVGTIVSGRNLPVDGIECSVGLFINTLPLIVDHNEQATKSVAAAAADIQSAVNAMNGRSTVELGRLQRGEMKRRLFDTLFVLENYPRLLDETTERQHRDVLRFDKLYDADKVDYPLAVVAREEDGELTITLWYAGEILDGAAVDTLLDVTDTLLDQVADDFSRPVGELEFTSPATIARLDEWNRTEVSFPDGVTLHGVFEDIAERRPDEVAVAHGNTTLTYRQLNQQANQLAHQLQETASLRPNDLVALIMDKSHLMITTIIAVWKTGAAYIPIDPHYPDDRISFMIHDTQARLILTDDEPKHTRLRQLTNNTTPPITNLTQLKLDHQPQHNPHTTVTNTDLAYAIYTSGTTGRPKAVLVNHGNVISFRNGLRDRQFDPSTSSRDAVLFLANYVFDFSIEQLVLSVLSGHKLIVPPPAFVPDDAFYEYANLEGLTYLSGTPTQVQQFDLSRLAHLRCVLVAGEAFQVHHFDKIRREYAGLILNAYGTTETTVYNTVRRFEPGDGYRNAFGGPLSNTRLYVLGDALRLLPTGAVGELYLAGDCVTDGYLNQPELTRQRFLANPFQTDAEQRTGRFAVVYKTGDVVRRHPDGEIQYLERTDAQVKIHGLRIEPAEVEAVLASCPGVRQCAVIARPDGRSPNGKRLVGYYVPDDGAAVHEDDMLATLRAKLMPSMIPSRLVRVDPPFPMTITGKLNTAALPNAESRPRRVAYAAPRDRTDARLCQLWNAQVADGQVGIDDDFFRSGGDSIGALHLASQVEREFGRTVSVKHIFDFPSVRRFADNVLSGGEDTVKVAERGRPSGGCPMLPIQSWFFAKSLADHNYWNQTFAVRTPPLDIGRLRVALDRLVDHHDAFRLRYRRHGDRIEQFYSDAQPHTLLYTLDLRHLRDADVQHQLMEWQRGFDLEHGPTYCAAYLHGFADGTARVWMAMHHLIVDVVSWGIIAQDLEILYPGGVLRQKSASYQHWAHAVRRYLPHQDERRLWAEITQSMTPNSSPASNPQTTHHGQFMLSVPETQALLTESQWASDSHINDLLLTAVGYALRSITRRAKNHITVEGHGRVPFDGAPDVRDTVGWFTTMYPFPVEVDDDLGRSIQLTKSNRIQMPHHGIGYGALRGGYGGEEAPLAPVSFNYLGHIDDGPGLSGWQLDAAMCGNSTAACNKQAGGFAVDVTMSCVRGHLVTKVDSRLSDADTQRFTDEMETRLKALIGHTSAIARKEAGRTYAVDAFGPYILVNEDEAGQTLCVLPPGEGGAESYLNNIARHLPGHRLVLFNNVHLHHRMDSFEALAQYYLDQIRRLQPTGPYSLLGWSFGGVLALEIALRLALAEQKINNLLLIDSYFNVRQASSDIERPEVEDILDPINYHYSPRPADLEKLRERTASLVLFKAGRVNDVVRGDDQRRLFEFYLRSPYNNLDTLLPAESIKIEPLPGETHHSWVQNQFMVADMCRRISQLLENPQEEP